MSTCTVLLIPEKELIVQLQNGLMCLSPKVCQFAALYCNITYPCIYVHVGTATTLIPLTL